MGLRDKGKKMGCPFIPPLIKAGHPMAVYKHDGIPSHIIVSLLTTTLQISFFVWFPAVSHVCKDIFWFSFKIKLKIKERFMLHPGKFK